MDMKETQTSQAKTMVVDDLQENRKAARKKRSPFSIIFEVLLYVAIIVFCIFVVPTYILQRTVVDGNSMQDTLQNGDSLLVNKFIYRIHDPERYDIIVFYPKGHDVDEYYVKRIYGLPGETLIIIPFISMAKRLTTHMQKMPWTIVRLNWEQKRNHTP